MKQLLSSLAAGMVFASAWQQPALAKSLSKMTVLVTADSDRQSGAAVYGEGDVVVDQPLVATGSAVLESPVAIAVRKTGNTRIELPAGTRLFETRSKKGSAVYCSVEDGFLVEPKVGKPFGLQVCFGDADSDGRFEMVYSSEKGRLKLPRLSMNRLMPVKREFEPIPYTVGAPRDGLSVDARIVLVDIATDSVAFELELQTDDGEWERHGRSRFDLSANATSVTPFGSQLSVVATDAPAGFVEIAVKQGFSRSRSLPLNPGLVNSKRDVELVD